MNEGIPNNTMKRSLCAPISAIRATKDDPSLTVEWPGLNNVIVFGDRRADNVLDIPFPTESERTYVIGDSIIPEEHFDSAHIQEFPSVRALQRRRLSYLMGAFGQGIAILGQGFDELAVNYAKILDYLEEFTEAGVGTPKEEKKLMSLTKKRDGIERRMAYLIEERAELGGIANDLYERRQTFMAKTSGNNYTDIGKFVEDSIVADVNDLAIVLANYSMNCGETLPESRKEREARYTAEMVRSTTRMKGIADTVTRRKDEIADTISQRATSVRNLMYAPAGVDIRRHPVLARLYRQLGVAPDPESKHGTDEPNSGYRVQQERRDAQSRRMAQSPLEDIVDESPILPKKDRPPHSWYNSTKRNYTSPEERREQRALRAFCERAVV